MSVVSDVSFDEAIDRGLDGCLDTILGIWVKDKRIIPEGDQRRYQVNMLVTVLIEDQKDGYHI